MASDSLSHPDWDESLFQDTAYFYARYRPPIPPAVTALIERELGLEGTGTLLDVGCGTGQMLIALASDFEMLVGIDPDPQMLSEAQVASDTAGIGDRVMLVEVGAPDLPDEYAPYRTLTISRAFHWMDRPATAQRAFELLEPGGSIVLLGDGSFWTGVPGWQGTVRAVVQSRLGTERRAGKATYADPEDTFDTHLRRAGFENVRELTVDDPREWDLEGILGYLYSTSFAAPHLFGDEREEFEKELAAALAKKEPDGGPFVEKAQFWVMIGRKPLED
jgi:SAM-dependent methyltransferase